MVKPVSEMTEEEYIEFGWSIVREEAKRPFADIQRDMV